MTQTNDTHLLFESHKYEVAQTELLDLFLTELSSIEITPQNFNNTKQFDLILFHLEHTFDRNLERRVNNENLHSALKVPSTTILHIIITLASRCPTSNWINNDSILKSSISQNEYIQSLNLDYNNSSVKSPLRDRCMLILNRFCHELKLALRSAELTDSNVASHSFSTLYKNLVLVFKELILHQKTIGVNRRSSHSSRNITRLSNGHKVKSNQLDIVSLMKSSPKKRKIDENDDSFLPTQEDPVNSSDLENTLDDLDEVSDSQEEDISLRSSMVDEVMKYKEYNLSPEKNSSINIIGHETSGMGQASDLFKNIRNEQSPEKLDSNDINDSSGSIHLSKSSLVNTVLHNIKIFDDPLLSVKLGTTPNYNIWTLLQWTCSCAENSSKFQSSLLYSSKASYHILYQTYRDVIIFIFDFLLLNFNYEVSRLLETNIENDNDLLERFFHIESKRSYILKSMSFDKRFLLLLLMTQLGMNSKDWHDRAVEFVFTGLNIESSYKPQPLYEREKHLVRQGNVSKLNTKEFSPDFNDNLDSMKIRYKILITIYYRLLFVANDPDLETLVSSSDASTPMSLISQTCRKLLLLDYPLFECFFTAYSSNFQGDCIPRRYQTIFISNLTKFMISELTKLVEIEDYFYSTETPASEKLGKILDLIQELDLYKCISEDISLKSWNEFSNNWLKLNYLVSLLLQDALHNVDSRLVTKEIKDIATCVDKKRLALYNKVIIDNSEINSTSSQFVISPKERNDFYINDVSNVTWTNFTDIIKISVAGF